MSGSRISFLKAVTLALLLGSAASRADVDSLSFHRLPLNNALAQNTVTKVVQDRSGLIWIATLGGLNVYDGYGFRVVSSDPRDPNALAGVYVNNIHEDRHGNLWIAGFHGWLDSLNQDTGKLTHHDPALYGGKRNAIAGVTAFLEADKGLWVGTSTGLHFYDWHSGEFELNAHERRTGTSIGRVGALAPASAEAMWVGTPQGLSLFNPESGVSWSVAERLPETAEWSRSLVAALHRDDDGPLWIGTSSSGLIRFVPQSGEFEVYRHDPERPNSLASDNVTDIMRDSSGRLWVSNHAGGLSLFVGGTRGFRVYRHDPNDPDSLPHDDVWSLYQDQSGLIWIGTAGAGLAQINPSTSRFNSLRQVPRNSNSLSHSFVWDIQQDAEGAIWFASLAGLDRYDPETGEFRHFQPAPGDPSPTANQLQSLHIDDAGQFWVGSVDGHLYVFEPSTGSFENIAREGAPAGRFSTNRVWYIGEGYGGRVWVSVPQGLFAVDSETRKIVESIKPSPEIPMLGTAVRTSIKDPGGGLWFGGGGSGLIRYHPGAGVTGILSHDPDNPASLSYNVVRSLHIDEGGNLWAGTINGLNRLSAENRESLRNHFTLYTRQQDLPDNTVYGILPGDAGRLWLSSNQGLTRFDPESGETTVFDVADGLAANELNGGAELKARDGRLYFGSVEGVSYFRAGDMPQNDHAPNVRLMRLEIAGTPHDSAAGAIHADPKSLDHTQNNIALEFTATDYHQPQKNEFSYRLLGLRDQWTAPGKRREVSYTNLAPGQYAFQARASNNDGVWGEPATLLSFRIAPPPWQTWWAYTLYAIATTTLLFAWQRYQSNKLRREREFSEALGQAQSLADANYRLALRYAQYDKLTGLPNRDSLLDALDRYIRIARETDECVGLLLINLERFKQINESFGFDTGDRLLQSIARRLQTRLRDNDYLARVGNDEFAVVTQATRADQSRAWYSRLATRLLDAVREPIEAGDTMISPKARIGAAIYPLDATVPDELLNCANVAVNAAQRSGMGAVVRFDADLLGTGRERMALESRLERALKRGEFTLHYQPIVNLSTGDLAGLEALIRWPGPDGRMEPPSRFIPVAEEAGLIVDIGAWVLEEACRQWQDWSENGLEAPWISVNVSARQLGQPSLGRRFKSILDRHGVPASALKVEITESAMLDHPRDTAAHLTKLRDIGIAIAVDDFGTGYSSLSHLKTLPLDALKIDRSFILDLESNEQSRTIVASTIQLAHELGLTVVAEGVEEQAVTVHLKSLGCEMAQGFLIARPLPADELETGGWLRAATGKID